MTCACGHADDEHDVTPTGLGACTVSIAEWEPGEEGPHAVYLDCACFLFEHDPDMDEETSDA